jgi:hypothetical protein
MRLGILHATLLLARNHENGRLVRVGQRYLACRMALMRA